MGDDLGYVKAPGLRSFEQRMHPFEQQHALHCPHRQHQENIILSQLLARNLSHPANAPAHSGPQEMHVFVSHCEHKSMNERSAAQHSSGQPSNLFTKHANCSLQPASPRPTVNRPRRRCPHSLYLCSYRPLRSPIRSFRSRYLGGADPCQLGSSQGRGISRALPGVP